MTSLKINPTVFSTNHNVHILPSRSDTFKSVDVVVIAVGGKHKLYKIEIIWKEERVFISHHHIQGSMNTVIIIIICP